MDRWAPSAASVDAIKFRHSFWDAARERTRRALVDAGFPLSRRYAFQECGGSALVWLNKSTGQVKVTCRCCHDRWCRACGRKKRQHLAKALTRAIPGHRAVHVVLTPRSSNRPLRDQVRALLASFARMRRRKWWRARAEGGAWVLELTYNLVTSQWHPHLHTIVHTSWMQLQELSQEWLKVTGDSHRVHISLVESNASAVQELSKYVGKIAHRSWEHSHDLLVCAMRALQGVRLCGTFGTWRGIQLDVPDDPPADQVWELWGTLDALYALARTRNAAALELIAQIHGKPPQIYSAPNAARAPPLFPEAAPT